MSGFSKFIYSTRAEMGRAAGQAAASILREALAQNGHARVILASAPSQHEMLEELVSTPDLDWSQVTIFHMDEYVGLGAEDPASFRSFQRQHVLSRIRARAFEGINGEAPDEAAECRRYAELLAAAPIDLVCLGIGENGHLAFNDPPVADFQDPLTVKVVTLDEPCRQQQVNDQCFPTLDQVPRRAITLTIPALMSGRALVCTVPGPRKARAVREAFHGAITTACPASILRRHANVSVFLDKASAGVTA